MKAAWLLLLLQICHPDHYQEAVEMGYTNQQYRTKLAAEDLSNHQFRFVKLNTAGTHVEACDGIGEMAYGVLQNTPTTGEPALIAAINDGGKMGVVVSGTVNDGNPVLVNASGQGTTGEYGQILGHWDGDYTNGDIGYFSAGYAGQTPYKIAVLGDSITADPNGYTATPWSALLATATGWQIDNFAVPGDKIADQAAIYTASVQGQGYTHLIIHVGVNDIVPAPGTDGTALAAACNAIGTTENIFRLEVLPFGNYSFDANDEALTLDYNSKLDNVYPMYSFAGEPLSTFDLLAAYDSGDGLHPNTAYHIAAAARIQNFILNPLY